MAKGEVGIEVAAPADKVWAVIADFGGLDAWMPGVESCTLEGDTRKLVINGMEILEQLKRSDDQARTMSYGIVGGAPMDHHLATLTVIASGDHAKVTWAYEVEPDAFGDFMGTTYQGAVEALKSHCEG